MQSAIRLVSHVDFPKFKDRQLYMAGMSLKTLSKQGLGDYEPIVRTMMDCVDIRGSDRFFVTIDEKLVGRGQTHRRGGAHIDGNWLEIKAQWDTPGEWTTAPGRWENDGQWATGTPNSKPRLQAGGQWPFIPGGPPWGYNMDFGGMLIASNEAAAVAWRGELDGLPGEGGDCEHLRDQFDSLTTVPMLANRVYLTNSSCVHESLPVQNPVRRQLIRITLPHDMKVL